MPSNAEAGLALARALRGAGDLKKADGQFERLMPLLDADASVEREYADLLMQRKNHGKAVAYYRRALDHGLKDERLLAGLAGALSADGKPREALPYLEEAYATRRSDRLAFDLAQLYRRLGQNERALQLLATIERGTRAPADAPPHSWRWSWGSARRPPLAPSSSRPFRKPMSPGPSHLRRSRSSGARSSTRPAPAWSSCSTGTARTATSTTS